MNEKVDFSIATSDKIAGYLFDQIEDLRLMRNMTQAQLAASAGISSKTLGRMKHGEPVSLDTFIRVLIALGVQENLKTLLPDTSVRPMDRISIKGKERKKASQPRRHVGTEIWSWGTDKKIDKPENNK
jgi:putative transcriptional regulator